jgi:hypothetical protein
MILLICSVFQYKIALETKLKQLPLFIIATIRLALMAKEYMF